MNRKTRIFTFKHGHITFDVQTGLITYLVHEKDVLGHITYVHKVTQPFSEVWALRKLPKGVRNRLAAVEAYYTPVVGTPPVIHMARHHNAIAGVTMPGGKKLDMDKEVTVRDVQNYLEVELPEKIISQFMDLVPNLNADARKLLTGPLGRMMFGIVGLAVSEQMSGSANLRQKLALSNAMHDLTSRAITEFPLDLDIDKTVAALRDLTKDKSDVV